MTTLYSFTDSDVDDAIAQLDDWLFHNAREAAKSESGSSPEMLIVAGAQGAGKTYLLEKQLLPSGRYPNHVRLYLPDFRKLHPQYEAMSEHGVLHEYEHTETFIRALSGKIFELAFANRYSIIMESALDDKAFAGFPPGAVAAGYRFEIHMIACKEEFSHWATLDRGVKSVEKGEIERFVALSQIQASQANARNILNAFEHACTQALGSEITLYERGFETDQQSKVLCHSTCDAIGVLTPQADYNGQAFFQAPYHDTPVEIRRSPEGSGSGTYLQFFQVVHAGMIDEPVRQLMVKACCKTLGRSTDLVPRIPKDTFRELSQYVLKYTYP